MEEDVAGVEVGISGVDRSAGLPMGESRERISYSRRKFKVATNINLNCKSLTTVNQLNININFGQLRILVIILRRKISLIFVSYTLRC